ncbi:MAG: hypothetical protein ACXVC7_01720 [Bacteroidia bacterium]
MKTTLLLITFLTGAFLCNAQRVKGVDVKVQHIAMPEKLLVQIHSDTLKLDSCQLKLINEKGIAVKTVNFFAGGKTIEASILMEDVEYGKYFILIIQGKTVLYQGEFFKDFIYADFVPNVINIDSIKK